MRSSKTAKALAMRSMQMLILASIVLLTAVAAMAQATTGSLRGTVADARRCGCRSNSDSKERSHWISRNQYDQRRR